MYIPADEGSMACCSGSNGPLKFKSNPSLIPENLDLAKYIIHFKCSLIQDIDDDDLLSFDELGNWSQTFMEDSLRELEEPTSRQKIIRHNLIPI